MNITRTAEFTVQVEVRMSAIVERNLSKERIKRIKDETIKRVIENYELDERTNAKIIGCIEIGNGYQQTLPEFLE